MEGEGERREECWVIVRNIQRVMRHLLKIKDKNNEVKKKEVKRSFGS